MVICIRLVKVWSCEFGIRGEVVIAVQRRAYAVTSPARLLRVWPDTNSAGEYKMIVSTDYRV